MGTDHRHRVCTFEEAEAAISSADALYLNPCLCRTPAREGNESWDYCGHPTETCIALRQPEEDEIPYPSRRISRTDALAIFAAWKGQGFFRFMVDDAWVCCCCSCGCGWFRDEQGNRVRDPCEKSGWIESTNVDTCSGCSACVDACAFDARSLAGDRIVVVAQDCYGCTACVDVCPTDSIAMVPRTAD